MPKFNVTMRVISLYDVEIEADTGAQARALIEHEISDAESTFVHDLVSDGSMCVDFIEVEKVRKAV